MTNTYKATPDFEAAFPEGVFEHEYTVEEERDLVGNGWLEIVPRTYKVLSDNSNAAGQGEEVELALPVEIEAALISGGHLERVDKKPPTKKTAKTKD